MICLNLFLFPLLSLSASLFLSSSAFSVSLSSSIDSTSDITTSDDSVACTAPSTYIESQIDLRAKIRPPPGTCSIHEAFYRLTARDTTDDFSCSETKPCSNGACCAKTGYCNYGPEACGTNGQSPNDKCWSNCDAHASCGQFAKTANATCLLNVCCSKFGFCGMTDLFCGKGCQSDCTQPGSGGSKGDVQSRIIGYYEGWSYNKNCIGMGIKDIPIGSITHLHFAFGFVTPNDFQVVPMPGLNLELFSAVTALKSQNTALKVLISLGGWTFNDNGTMTQPVFSDMVSSPSKRAAAITNILSFLQQFAFDGVDFDWEYPGASDRGGHDDDGTNFTQFLKELQNAIGRGPTKYLVSFTAPTSYWYLQHFDVKNMMGHVDWANVMSYDLHGIWDRDDPIGNHVLAHTNLSEIKSAMDLFWRNGVKPDQINLGVGFYGRSFQLADSSCSRPGCLFKGGAAPGPCTDQSGVLSYREIMDVIKLNNLSPYYDKENAVKYVTWDADQWVSYDDQETFQQKIKYANDIGLGGLLVWALDLDTSDLHALQGLVYPKTLNAFSAGADTKDNWNDAAAGDCRTTDCGVTSCKPGEIKLINQWCNDKSAATCCPLASAPDPSKCKWRGTPPFCNGQCLPGEVAIESNRKGNGKWCSDGLQFYCCEVPNYDEYKCHWSDCGGSCDSTSVSLTWAYADCLDGKRQLCCPTKNKWENCAWHGKPGSCFDDHCDTGHQVELGNSYDGEGDDCGPHLERTRVFCCDQPKGASPFLPVPLDYLFPNPPPKDSAHTEFKLKVDPTFGGAAPGAGFLNDPHDAEFGFFVLTSPEELQVSLDKRDGSHWEVFDCFESVSEEEQTVHMICDDFSPQSNCHKIHLGHGAVGTIVEMPNGCGLGRYAVVKDLRHSSNQTLPGHLSSRELHSSTVVYALTFDYDFSRVPRDLGETQMRLDFSNEDGYWDKVVDKAGDHKRKRSLDDFGGNKRRWLEDAWREDMHLGSLSREELHKRWFGSDALDWLKGLLNGVTGGPKISNTYQDDFTVVLLDEQYGPCKISGVDVEGRLQIQAKTTVNIDTNFGLTIIATLGGSKIIDLHNSYLYFRNSGDVEATFTLDAITSATFQTGDILLLSADKFGATFSVPGILTVGPNFKLFGAAEGGVTIAAHVESQVKLAQWDVQQTFPDVNHDWDPQATKNPTRDGTQKLGSPTFNYSVAADGFITAHVKPTFTFGIDFNPKFISVDSATINLVADGYVTAYATAGTSNTDSSFCYGVNAGADLYASVQVPDAFGWDLSVPRYQVAPAAQIEIVPQNCPISSRDLSDDGYFPIDSISYAGHSALLKRGQVYGPLVRLKDLGFSLGCPGDESPSNLTLPCPLCGSDDTTLRARDRGDCSIFQGDPNELVCGGSSLTRRSLELGLDYFDIDTINATEYHTFDKRANKALKWPTNLAGFYPDLDAGSYPSCAAAISGGRVTKYYTFDDPGKVCSAEIFKYNKNQIPAGVTFQTEHVFEAQLIRDFLQFLKGNHRIPMPTNYAAGTDDWVTNVVVGYDAAREYTDPNGLNLWSSLTQNLGGSGGDGLSNMAILDTAVNGIKGTFFGLGTPSASLEPPGNSPTQIKTKLKYRNTAGVFRYLAFNNAVSIWDKFTGPSNGVEETLHTFDTTYAWGSNPQGELRRPANGGLRNLWCYWIDTSLGTIESNAATWASNAKATYEQEWGGSAQGKNWLSNAMSGNGLVTAGQMKFPRSVGNAQQTSRYGVWGNSGIGAPGPFAGTNWPPR